MQEYSVTLQKEVSLYSWSHAWLVWLQPNHLICFNSPKAQQLNPDK